MAMHDRTRKDVGVDEILSALAEADSNEAFDRVLESYSGLIFRSFDLMSQLARRAAELSSHDPPLARRILELLERTGRDHGRVDLQSRMMAAETDEDVRALIRDHSDEVTPSFAATAIAEARRLLQEPNPLAIDIADRVLRRGELMAEHLGDDRLKADAVLHRGAVLSKRGDHAAGAQHCLEAGDHYGRLDMRFEQARAIGQAGSLMIASGAAEAAEPLLHRSLELLADDPDADKLAAPTHEELAMIAAKSGRWGVAADHFERAAGLRAKLEQPERAAAALRGLVVAKATMPSQQDILEHVERAVAGSLEAPPINQAADDLAAFAECITLPGFWSALSSFSSSTSPRAPKADPDHARRWTAVVAQVRPWLIDRIAIARADIVVAIGLFPRRPDDAFEMADGALRILRNGSLGDHLGAALVVARIGMDRGRAARALEVIEDAEARFATARQTPPPMQEQERRSAENDIALGLLQLKSNALLALGRMHEALDVVESARQLDFDMDRWEHRYVAAFLESQRADVAFSLRDIERSIRFQLGLIQSAQQLGYLKGEVSACCSLGVSCGMMADSYGQELSARSRQDLLEAIVEAVPEVAPADDPSSVGRRLVQHALATAERLGDVQAAVRARGILANFTEDPRERLEALHAAYAKLLAAGGAGSSRQIVLSNMGKAYKALRDFEAAENCLAQSLRLSDRSGTYGWAYDTATELADLASRRNDAGEVALYLRRAIAYIELARLSVPDNDRARVTFARGRVEAYERLVLHDWARYRIADAFEVLQQMKSRALVAAYSRRVQRQESGDDHRAADLHQREAGLVEELRTLSEGSRSKFDVLSDLERSYETLEEFDPVYVARQSGRALGLSALRQVLARQPRSVLLIDFFVPGNGALAFLMRGEWDAPIAVQLPTSAANLGLLRHEIERQIVRYRSRGPATWRTAAEPILAPLVQYLRADDLVYIVPHGALHGLPIHLFPIDGVPFCDRHDVVYLPAASLLPLAERRRQASEGLRSALCLGVDFVEEAEAVANLFDKARVLVGPLTADEVASAVEANTDVVHISAHGDYRPEAPELSGILIGGLEMGRAVDPASVLTAERIADMNLDCEILCLSACKSGLARLSQGDEQLGIQRSCFLAGASSVISTLWPVEPSATQTFMIAFYQALLSSWTTSGRIDKPAALRAARRLLRENPATASEYYWAAFTLTGDWK